MSTRYVWNRNLLADSNIPNVTYQFYYLTRNRPYIDQIDFEYGYIDSTGFHATQTSHITGDLHLTDSTIRLTSHLPGKVFTGDIIIDAEMTSGTAGGSQTWNMSISGNEWDGTFQKEKGAFDGYTSSSINSAYPQDGVSGSYWYVYQGSDNIDPSRVDYVSSPQGGKPITLTVTPSAGKVYEGTVSYQYQVKLGSGEWTTIATTSATSYQYTIPYGTTTFQARVRAQDNLGFTSNDYVTGTQVTVINNQPPTAPGSIEVTNVVSGQQATITLTAATDPDGTIASYIYERSVDGSAWEQIANVNALTYQDTVSGDWGTVAYRACAVDSGPYVTSETTTVNSGWVIISGPASDMGDKPAPFSFVFSVSVTGQASVDAISATATLDGESVYTGTPNSGVEVSIPVDTRLMSAGEHTIQIQATKESYVEASGSYTFNVPAVTLPDGGRAEMLQNPEGNVVFPYTLARFVIGKGGKDMNVMLEQALSTVTDLSGEVAEVKAGALKMATGNYAGTGTYGEGNPNSLAFEFSPRLVIVVPNNAGVTNDMGRLIMVYGASASMFSPNAYSSSLTWGDKSISWYYSNDANNQCNRSGQTYYWFAIGQ